MSRSHWKHREHIEALDRQTDAVRVGAEKTAKATKDAATRTVTAVADAADEQRYYAEKQMEQAAELAAQQRALARQETERRRLRDQRQRGQRRRWLEFREAMLRENPGMDEAAIELQYMRAEEDDLRRTRENFAQTVSHRQVVLQNVALDDICRDENTIRYLGPAGPGSAMHWLHIGLMLGIQVLSAGGTNGSSLLSLIPGALVAAWSVARFRWARTKVVSKHRPPASVKNTLLVASKGLPVATLMAGVIALSQGIILLPLVFVGYGLLGLFDLKSGGMEEEKEELAQRKQETAAYQAYLANLAFDDWYENGMPQIPYPPIVD